MSALPYPPTSRRASPLVPVGLAVIVALPLVTYLGDPYGDPRPTALAAAVGALALVPFIIAWSRKDLDPGEPIFGIAVTYFLLFSARTLYIQAGGPSVLVSPYPYRDALDAPMLLALLGFAVVLAGYYGPIGGGLARRLPRLAGSFPAKGAAIRVVLILALGVGTQLILTLAYGQTFFTTGQGVNASNGNVLFQLGNFASYGVAAASILAARARATGRGRFWSNPLLLAAGGSAIIIGLLYSTKSDAITALGIIALVYNYRVRRIPLRVIALIAAVVLFVVFPVIASQRALRTAGYVNASTGTLDRITAGVGQVFADIDQGPTRFVSAAYASLMARETGTDSLALIYRYTPLLAPYKSPAEFFEIPAIAFVPRFAWPGKPLVSPTEFGRDYLAYTGTASFAETNLGDLYRHGGVPIVLLGAFVLGMFYRLVYRWLIGDGEPSDSALFVYAILATTIVVSSVEGNLVAIYSQIIKTIPILLIAAAFLCAGQGGLFARDAPRE